MKVRIIKSGRKCPVYILNMKAGDKAGRLVETGEGADISQDLLKKLFDAAKAPSREAKHDRYEQAAQIKELRSAGLAWGKIGAVMRRSAHATQALYQRYYEKKCPVCNANSMKKVQAKLLDRHLTPYWWECTNDRCRTKGGDGGSRTDEADQELQTGLQQDEGDMP